MTRKELHVKTAVFNVPISVGGFIDPWLGSSFSTFNGNCFVYGNVSKPTQIALCSIKSSAVPVGLTDICLLTYLRLRGPRLKGPRLWASQ